MKNFHSNELEDFKKNYKERIAELAKSKTEWLEDLKNESQQKRNQDKITKQKENNELNEYLKATEDPYIRSIYTESEIRT